MAVLGVLLLVLGLGAILCALRMHAVREAIANPDTDCLTEQGPWSWAPNTDCDKCANYFMKAPNARPDCQPLQTCYNSAHNAPYVALCKCAAKYCARVDQDNNCIPKTPRKGQCAPGPLTHNP